MRLLVASADIYDLGEGDSFGGTFIVFGLFEGEEVVLGDDGPSSKILQEVLPPSFKNSWLFLQKSLVDDLLQLFFQFLSR